MSSDPLVMKLIEENKALTLRLDECLKAMQAALAENERIQLAGELGAKSAYRVVKHLLAPLGVVEVASAVERRAPKDWEPCEGEGTEDLVLSETEL